MTKRGRIFAEKIGDTHMKTNQITLQASASASSFSAAFISKFFSPDSSADIQGLINDLGLEFVGANKI